MNHVKYNPYLYIIMCVDKGKEYVFTPFHNGKKAEEKCKQLNDDYGPCLKFYVIGKEAGDKPN